MGKRKGPKVLVLDIETAPILGYVWGLWDQNVGLNQMHSDTYILSWSAKWLDDKNVMYMDQRKEKDIEDDSLIMAELWQLLDECDVVLTHNGVKFDMPRINARFLVHGFQPPSGYKHIDTLKIARSKFGFTSNKLEYLTHKLCKKNKKLKHKKFNGFELWKECLAGNIKAWKEMEAYNKMDVLSLEELYHIMIPWDASINFSLYTDDLEYLCTCGCTTLHKNGLAHTAVSSFQRYKCAECGKEVRGRKCKMDKKKKKAMKTKVRYR